MPIDNAFEIRLKHLLPVLLGVTSGIVSAKIIAEKRAFGFKDMVSLPLSP